MAPGGLPRTLLPRTPPARSIPRAAVAAASPQGPPAPGCGAPPSLAGGFPRAPVPGLPGALRRAAFPGSPLPEDGRASSRAAPLPRSPGDSRARPSGGTGTGTGTGRHGGAEAAGLAEGRAAGCSRIVLPQNRAGSLRPGSPGRSRLLSQGLSARIPTRRLRFPARRRFPPTPVPRPRCGGTWACGAPQRSPLHLHLHLHLPPSNPASPRLGTAASILRPPGPAPRLPSPGRSQLLPPAALCRSPPQEHPPVPIPGRKKKTSPEQFRRRKVQRGAQRDAGGCSRTALLREAARLPPAPGRTTSPARVPAPSSPGTLLPWIFRALSPGDGREKGGSGAQ